MDYTETPEQAALRDAVRAAFVLGDGISIAGGRLSGVAHHVLDGAAADVFWHVAAEMVQLHGGIGFTWEHEAHRYLKRAKTTQLLHGSPADLRRLIARRAGLV